MKKEKNMNKEKKHRGNAGEIFVKGMALILALLMIVAAGSSLIYYAMTLA